ncbi:hypothetical protein NLM33_25100 [Bradyrhizobium sp. CCGUVB1N3]|uniref:hypothetical protein n=1 Tax=Bradyrhizobium sp. CCGUVB1N3 TaxID=2949629 RepID=UPI0020B3BE53|nr:hypothetical protein [Bradyrhizobium sp. CCGUVB1N3]MCP3471814.1 hypothetical protein [Bradyrhizobium sp. CCGUVB1N3]MCP3473596.1 hypothetical protein [Bradyrhizobium sp. CCGUVB1N3]
MARTHDWRIDLIEAHAALFRAPVGHPEQASGYPWCKVGWRDLLERLCQRIETALREGETVHFNQIKEKFAGLRCYWRGDVSPQTAAKIHEAVALAGARSACTCERCGAEGRLYNDNGIYMTRCVLHGQGMPVPSGPGQQNVHVVRLPTPSGFRLVARRYDREADRFSQPPSHDREH